MSGFLPGFPPAIANLIQTNALVRMVFDGLTSTARYRADATREKLAMGTGQTATFNRMGHFSVDLRPAAKTGATPRGQYGVESFTASPEPFANSFDVDAPTAYAQIGSYIQQGISRLGEWAGRTASRKARGKLFGYLAGQSIIRRAQTSEAILLVNSLAGFRHKWVNGVPTPVSSANALGITIVAGTTFTALVTGVVPLDPDFPDGPGELILSTGLSASVSANSYCYVTDARPQVVRPNDRASTQALQSTDIPTLANVLAMRAKLIGLGVRPHLSTGTYHLHVDETFFPFVTQDTAWRTAFQGAGLSPIFGAGSFVAPQLGLTVIENNDSPARGKGVEVQVGDSTHGGTGGAGTPGSSQTLQDCGLDTMNSSGVYIRRAIMTGQDVMIESFVDEMAYVEMMGGKLIHQITDNLAAYQIGSNQYVMGNIEGWRLLVRPPLDERALVATITVSNTFDFVLGTDKDAASNIADLRPYKRAMAMEYGSSW